MEAIRVRDKLKERFLRTKLHVDHERFKEQHNSVQQKIKNKKMNFVRNQLQMNSNKAKELWKVLKILACLLKQPQYQKYALKKIISLNLMTNKIQTYLRTFTQSLHQI